MKVYALVYTNTAYELEVIGIYSSNARAVDAWRKCNADVRMNSSVVPYDLDKPAPDMYLAEPVVAAVVADVAATAA